MEKKAKNFINWVLIIGTEFILLSALIVLLTRIGRFKEIFNALGIDLPLLTRLNFFLMDHWYILVGVMVIYLVVQKLLWAKLPY